MACHRSYQIFGEQDRISQDLVWGGALAWQPYPSGQTHGNGQPAGARHGSRSAGRRGHSTGAGVMMKGCESVCMCVSQVPGLVRLRVHFGDQGSRVQGTGFRAQGSGRRVQGTGFRAHGAGSGHRVQGTGFRAQGSGHRVPMYVLLVRGPHTIDLRGCPVYITCMVGVYVWGQRAGS